MSIQSDNELEFLSMRNLDQDPEDVSTVEEERAGALRAARRAVKVGMPLPLILAAHCVTESDREEITAYADSIRQRT